MRNLLQSAMIAVMALLLFVGVGWFGSVTPRMAIPLYGAALVLGLMWAAKLLVVEVVSWKKSLMHLPVAAFAIYAGIRYFTSPLEYPARLELFKIAVCTFVYFLAAANFYRARDRSTLIWTLMIIGMAQSVFALWQFGTRPTTIFGFERAENYYHRGSGTFFCPNHLAAFLELALCMVVARLALYSSPKVTMQKLVVGKVLLAFGALIMLAGLLATQSRAGWLATVMVLIFLVVLGDWKWSRFLPRLGVVVGVLAILGFCAFKVESVRTRFVHSYYQATTDGTVNLKVSTLRGRIELWKSTLEMIREHPVWGSGGGSWEWLYPKHRPETLTGNPEYAHNGFLNLLSDYGLIGFALIAMVMISFYAHAFTLSRAAETAEEKSFAVGAMMAITANLLHAATDFNMHILANSVTFLAIMGFVVAMDVNREESDRVLLTPRLRTGLAFVVLLGCLVATGFFIQTAVAYQYMKWGDYADSRFEYDTALGFYRKAIAVSSKDPAPYSRVGNVYLSQSQWRMMPARKNERAELARQAVDWYKKSLKLNPYNLEIWLRLAQAYEILEEKTEVVSCCNKIIELDPASPDGYSYLGRFYMRQNNLDGAEKAYEKAKQLNFGRGDPTPYMILDEIRVQRQEMKGTQ